MEKAVIQPEHVSRPYGSTPDEPNEGRHQPRTLPGTQSHHIHADLANPVDPRGMDCLKKILSGIRAKLHLKSESQLCLYVIDDIDFDCQQPSLEQVLEELLSNAAAALRAREEQRIEVLATQYEGRLFVQVADNGPGLPKNIVQWLERAQHGASSCESRSGLESVLALVRQEGGQLSLVNSGERGTRLGFSLPLTDDSDRTVHKSD